MKPSDSVTFELRKEDYAEPRCLLCDPPYGADTDIRPVPQQRIAEKLDSYMGRRDYAGAERHLLYWLDEAVLGGDARGELFLRNELTGHYRKMGNREKALENASRALELLDSLSFDGSVSYGTTCVNAATAFHAFGEHERALQYFEKARSVYEKGTGTSPELLGGLYNNMGLVCNALGRYEEALSLYEKAISVMGQVPGGVLEQAITCLNMADTIAARDGNETGEEEINALLDRAETLLKDPSVVHDGYYAFVCEKCAPTFSWYGYFLTAQELTGTADRIYKKNNE